MSVHHVDVDHPGAGSEHLGYLRAEPGEISRQDRWRDPQLGQERPPPGRVCGRAHTATSIEPWQLLQATIAVVDIRTIVECSPQLGQTETSSYRCRQ